MGRVIYTYQRPVSDVDLIRPYLSSQSKGYNLDANFLITLTKWPYNPRVYGLC